jgi:hypothetical protein
VLVSAASFWLGGTDVCTAGHGSSGHGSGGHEAAPGESEHGSSEHGEAEAGSDANANANGILLGEYRVRAEYPVEAQKITVRFVLYATSPVKHSAEMRELVESHQQRIRDLVITTTRLAPLALLEEPDLSAFRRRLIIRLRRALPELTLDELYISDFGLMIRSL